ncbi:MAG TPA: hypothetical protein VHD38_03625, partial [Candidatus Paceibacterota bacterium]|nr:hypothetical protein [Candidatus Paceibacterota bacterium]
MAIALAIFLISLLGIAILFALKYWEERRGMPILPASRERADMRAQALKAYLLRMRTDAGHLLPIMVRIFSGLLHVAALSLAGVARSIERELHRLAEMVSHKRNFQPRETKSDFLRQV